MGLIRAVVNKSNGGKDRKRSFSMRKAIVMLVLAIAVAGGVSAQTGSAKNWISGQIGLFNAGVGYERVLTPALSVGGQAYFNSFFFFWNSVAVEAFAKYYPFQGNFYGKLGLGFGTISGTDNDWVYITSGFLIDPGIGWKIDVGQPGGFFIEPKISVPIVLGKRDYDALGGNTKEGEFKVGVNFVAAFGMGYAF
jgi:hypothetical protein